MSQTVMPRNAAALSTTFPSSQLNETTIVAGPDRAMSVCHVLSATSGQIEFGFSLASLQANGTWIWTSEGVINPGTFVQSDLTDPAVAADPVTGDFLIVGLTLEADRDIVAARWNRSTELFEPWARVSEGIGNAFDKPWIVARPSIALPGGAAGPTLETQFYITWKGLNGNLSYLRSRDSGHTWLGGLALKNVNDPMSVYGFTRSPAPRLFALQPIYVGYLAPVGGPIKVARGIDVDSGAHAGEVQFTELIFLDSIGRSLQGIPLNLTPQNIFFIVAGPDFVGGSTTPNGPGFDLAVDPTNANRLYVTYQDVPNPGDTDANIYLRVLTKVAGTNATWTIGDRILVADDPNPEPEFETDQFMPAIDVDGSGRIHVIYYDDRKYRPGQTDSTIYPARFDVLYSWASPGGTDFGVPGHFFELCDDPPTCLTTEPAVHLKDPTTNPGFLFPMRDYIGIDIGGGRVWTSFMGTSDVRDPSADKSLIWSSQILWP